MSNWAKTERFQLRSHSSTGSSGSQTLCTALPVYGWITFDDAKRGFGNCSLRSAWSDGVNELAHRPCAPPGVLPTDEVVQMRMDKPKTMLITGGSRGIGAATAILAASRGWRVVLTFANDAQPAQSVVDRIQELGGQATSRQSDVAIESDVLALFGSLDADDGIDCLVNNAGIAPGYGPFESLSVADMERTWAVNITGAFLCAREAVRRMSTANGGRGGSIVNISSKAAAIGGPNEWIHYAASKGAIDTLTHGLCKEYAARGIRVNAVRPGLIDGGFGPWAPEHRVASMRAMIPMQREAAPEEVAESIVWLASDAASYVTGAILDVTGGR